ncbi:MAG: H4MPT-linked C1 transfer pathway protein [Methanoregulaceae archaeon]|nr:H4MPT-linked C1 transfer pathway protein [Methanoregulaceae archaeon]
MIGIDVGGANLKIATRDGIAIHYCPLWEESPIRDVLRGYYTAGEQAAVVMSGELADCFCSKDEGIRFIVDLVREVFPDARFYGTDAAFHDTAVPALAAANWLVSAEYLMDQYPGSLLVDLGSTTTDIIPLSGLEPLKGLTDLSRLQRGYLLYTGLLRTTVPALVREVTLRGVPTPVCPEFFAISADVHLVLSHITKQEYAVDTPDRKGKDRVSALRRLARVVCADLEEIGDEGAYAVAQEFWSAQRDLLLHAVRRVAGTSPPAQVLCAGIGAGLLSGLFGGRNLAADLGHASDALPAFAVREVAERRPGRLD